MFLIRETLKIRVPVSKSRANIMLETNLRKEKWSKSRQEQFSNYWLRPFRYKLAGEAEKQFSTEFPSRALFFQELPGSFWLLPSRNETSSNLLTFIKLPL